MALFEPASQNPGFDILYQQYLARQKNTADLLDVVGDNSTLEGEFTTLEDVVTALVAQIPAIGTPQATTSGTAWDFTIPSWAKHIDVMFDGFSTDGTQHYLVQIGDAGGIEDAGYKSSSSSLVDAGAVVVTAEATTGFVIRGTSVNVLIHGMMHLSLMNSTTFTWTANGIFHRSDAVRQIASAGSKSLSSALTTVRVTSVSAPDAGDAGSVNVSYW